MTLGKNWVNTAANTALAIWGATNISLVIFSLFNFNNHHDDINLATGITMNF